MTTDESSKFKNSRFYDVQKAVDEFEAPDGMTTRVFVSHAADCINVTYKGIVSTILMTKTGTNGMSYGELRCAIHDALNREIDTYTERYFELLERDR